MGYTVSDGLTPIISKNRQRLDSPVIQKLALYNQEDHIFHFSACSLNQTDTVLTYKVHFMKKKRTTSYSHYRLRRVCLCFDETFVQCIVPYLICYVREHFL